MRLDKDGMPVLTAAQKGRLPAFPAANADLEGLWRWAATTSPQDVPGAFLGRQYTFGLRRAQGWDQWNATSDGHSGSGRCQSDRDGDCNWSGCPQLRDGEPGKTHRSCPLWETDPEL